jgi:hypothetical protein
MDTENLKLSYKSLSDQHMSEESFGVKDRFGREIGARVWTHTVTYTLEPPEGQPVTLSYRNNGKAGTFYGFTPQATRNGQRYGASQSAAEFPTEKERDAAVKKYMAGARKRAIKNFGVRQEPITDRYGADDPLKF